MTMASLNKAALGSEEEDDLEFLRLAALKSLKPKSSTETQSKPPGNNQCKPQHSYNKPATFGAAHTTRHHNRGFRNNLGRGGRNGINPRIRTNTNLIAIQTIDPDEPKEQVHVHVQVKETSCDIPKLILPQDRYHKPQITENSTKESSGNKFDRYDDNSDESESDDESESKPSRRERKDSVEQLMDDLENEINLLEGKDEIKPIEESELSDSERVMDAVENKSETTVQSDTLIISEIDPDLVQIEEPKSPVKENKPVVSETVSPSNKCRSRSPFIEKSHLQKRKSRTKSRSRSPLPLSTQYKSPYRSPRRSRSPLRKTRYSPNHYPRALSPLTLNTEVLNTITMAPLSPRSAAFVLENRQILARRQMSPRRSLSRESGCRRSLTPKRNKSPRRRSRTPIKRSLSPRKRSLSPRQSPRRRSNSPRTNYHRRSPYKSVKRSSNSPILNKQPIHKRLTSRPNSRNVSPFERKTETSAKRKRTSRSISLSLSPSPDRNYHKRPLNETTGYLNDDAKNRRDKSRKDSPKSESKSKEDPILEARRRKFESPVQINNGIIKLKTSKTDEETNEDSNIATKIETAEESSEEKDEEEIEDVEETDSILDLNPTLDDLWSDDDDSDDENEGRFKSKPSSDNKRVTVLPFRKLTERPIPKSLSLRDDKDRRDRKYKRQRRRRSRTPLKSSNKTESKKESDNRDRSSLDSKSKVVAENKEHIKPVEEEKKKEKSKIVSKIEGDKSTDILKTLYSDKNVKRKVKIQEVSDAGDSNVENTEQPEVVEIKDAVSNKDDEKKLIGKCATTPLGSLDYNNGGDLRAELSRRRAERLIMASSLAESLPTRLLKNALQEVVPKRPAAKQSKLKGSDSSADRRVLILKRLASSSVPAPQLEPANKVATKEGKLPIHMRLGSNPDVEEPVRDRRNKRPGRSGRRKKQVQV